MCEKIDPPSFYIRFLLEHGGWGERGSKKRKPRLKEGKKEVICILLLYFMHFTYIFFYNSMFQMPKNSPI
jgi:hypothetical protein